MGEKDGPDPRIGTRPEFTFLPVQNTNRTTIWSCRELLGKYPLYCPKVEFPGIRKLRLMAAVEYGETSER